MGLISRLDSLRDCHVYLGGTFDPVHNGHIRMLVEGREALSASHASFVPCHVTPHKQQPSTATQHRLSMLHVLAKHCSVIRSVSGLSKRLSYPAPKNLTLFILCAICESSWAQMRLLFG